MSVSPASITRITLTVMTAVVVILGAVFSMSTGFIGTLIGGIIGMLLSGVNTAYYVRSKHSRVTLSLPKEGPLSKLDLEKVQWLVERHQERANQDSSSAKSS